MQFSCKPLQAHFLKINLLGPDVVEFIVELEVVDVVSADVSVFVVDPVTVIVAVVSHI